MEAVLDYTFKIGKAFAKKSAESPKEYLTTAEGVHHYIKSFKKETPEGIYWKIPEKVISQNKALEDLSLYGGSTGVLYYYLELYKITGREKYKALVEGGADYLSKNWKKQVEVAQKSVSLKGIEHSIYMGITGIATVLSKVYLAFGRQRDIDTVREITDYVIKKGRVTENGLEWSYDKSPLLGGGTVLYLYKIYELLGDKTILEAANSGADKIISEAIEDLRGGYAWKSYAHPNNERVPNFECGTAGVGYVLTVAYQVSGDKKYLQAAIEAAKHIRAIAIKQGKGYLVPWHDNDKEETIFYVSTCHGPAGTSKLFYQLYKITGEKKYLEFIHSLYLGLRHIGVPEIQSKGYWNTVSLCCGTAGVLQFLINYSLIKPDREVAKVAESAAEILLGQQERQGDKGVAWALAFERVNPHNISRGISNGAGASGIALALLQYYLFVNKKYSWDRLFDDPYPSKV